jgi:hypothetical protein
MNMSESKFEKCSCEDCARYRKMELSETALHAFLGLSEPNFDCMIEEFEADIEYTNLLHWDVSQCGVERYCIYRNDDGVLLAWYDRINEVGYKQYSIKENSTKTCDPEMASNIR